MGFAVSCLVFPVLRYSLDKGSGDFKVIQLLAYRVLTGYSYKCKCRANKSTKEIVELLYIIVPGLQTYFWVVVSLQRDSRPNKATHWMIAPSHTSTGLNKEVMLHQICVVTG